MSVSSRGGRGGFLRGKPGFFAMSTRRWFVLSAAILLMSIVLIGCSGPVGDTSKPKATSTSKPKTTSTPTPSAAGLAKLHWCKTPLMVFRDEGATVAGAATPGTHMTPVATLAPANGTPATIADWSVFKANLGFSVYLPVTLPGGACLASASGTVRDPILGSSFTISFLLPNHDSLSLSEAPVRSKGTDFQCTPNTKQDVAKDGTPTATAGATQAPVQLCTGARDTTNIVFSSRGTTGDLQAFFQALQPNVEWIPA